VGAARIGDALTSNSAAHVSIASNRGRREARGFMARRASGAALGAGGEVWLAFLGEGACSLRQVTAAHAKRLVAVFHRDRVLDTYLPPVASPSRKWFWMSAFAR